MSDMRERVEDILEDVKVLYPDDYKGWGIRLKEAIERQREMLEDCRDRVIRIRKGVSDEGLVEKETRQILMSLQWLLDGIAGDSLDYKERIVCRYCGYRGDESGCEVLEKDGLYFVHCLGPGCGVMGPMNRSRDKAIAEWRGITEDMVRKWGKEKENERWQIKKNATKRKDCLFFKDSSSCAKFGGVSCPKDCAYFKEDGNLF